MPSLGSELNQALRVSGDLWCPRGQAVLREAWREDYTAQMLLPNASWGRREKRQTKHSRADLLVLLI